MKKSILKISMVATLAAITGYGIYAYQTENTLSDIALANVEALAQGEVIIGTPCRETCINCWCIYGGDIWVDGEPYVD